MTVYRALYLFNRIYLFFVEVYIFILFYFLFLQEIIQPKYSWRHDLSNIEKVITNDLSNPKKGNIKYISSLRFNNRKITIYQSNNNTNVSKCNLTSQTSQKRAEGATTITESFYLNDLPE